MKIITTKVLFLIIVCLSLSVAEGQGDLTVSGATLTNDLAIMALDCTANTNGGTLTTDDVGMVVCSDDDGTTAPLVCYAMNFCGPDIVGVSVGGTRR